MSLTLHDLKELYDALLTRYEDIGIAVLDVELKLRAIKKQIETIEQEGRNEQH
jgi:hypothetical protein